MGIRSFEPELFYNQAENATEALKGIGNELQEKSKALQGYAALITNYRNSYFTGDPSTIYESALALVMGTNETFAKNRGWVKKVMGSAPDFYQSAHEIVDFYLKSEQIGIKLATEGLKKKRIEAGNIGNAVERYKNILKECN